MNTKQFISSVWLSGIDFGSSKFPILGHLAAIPLRLAFPTMLYERVNFTRMPGRAFLVIYLLGLAICFGLQALLAYQAGTLGVGDGTFGIAPDQDPSMTRLTFLKDGHNLLNYVVLVPLYLVAGIGYLLSVFSMQHRMQVSAPGHGFEIDTSKRSPLSGLALLGLLVGLVTLAQSQYAMDMHETRQLFWFHGDSIGSAFKFNGYAYLLINAFLCTFVAVVALAHLELFRWSTILTQGLRTYKVDPEHGSIFLNQGDRLKEIFAPFTETAIWSKAFAMLLAMNLYTWKASGVSAAAGMETNSFTDDGLFIRLIFVVYLVIVLWFISLPRYRVQFEIFKLRKAEGIHEYFDIRMPWTVGWSVFIDVLLISFFSTMILGQSELFNLLSSFIPS